MPKATLKFNLPEEREEYETAYKGAEYRNALLEFSEKFVEWDDGHPKPDYESIRKEFFKMIDEYGFEV